MAVYCHPCHFVLLFGDVSTFDGIPGTWGFSVQGRLLRMFHEVRLDLSKNKPVAEQPGITCSHTLRTRHDPLYLRFAVSVLGLPAHQPAFLADRMWFMCGQTPRDMPGSFAVMLMLDMDCAAQTFSRCFFVRSWLTRLDDFMAVMSLN